MTVTESRSRQDRRPDWLRQKHAQQPADPKLTAWADKVITILAADRTQPRGLFAADDDTARRWKNAMYEAHKRWNRNHPDDQISLSCNVIDPRDGRCKARGTERCSQNGCPPTPGHYGIHARVYSKRDGRAHQGAKPREQWDYDPMTPRSRQAAKVPGRAFGADRIPATEDEPPDRSGFRRTPKPVASDNGRTTRASGSPRGNFPRQQQAPAPAAEEGAFAKIRRWASG
jgi:hypothetical protein